MKHWILGHTCAALQKSSFSRQQPEQTDLKQALKLLSLHFSLSLCLSVIGTREMKSGSDSTSDIGKNK